MKLKAYSQNNPLNHLIRHTFKRFLWLPIVMLVLTSVVFIATELLQDNHALDSLQYYEILPTFVFKNSEIWELFPLFLVLISIISAYVMFSFLFNKKSATMMMLAGFSRTQLFLTRYVFGLLSVLLPFLASFAVLLRLGAENVGMDDVAVTKNMVILVLMLAVTVIYSYTVSVIAASLCGRKIEFFAVISVFIFGAQGILLFVSLMSASFLHGFPYMLRPSTQLDFPFGGIFDKYSCLSVGSLFKDALGEYVISGNQEAYPVDMSAYRSELIWLLFITLCLVLLAVRIFKTRNSEFDGKSNSNKILSAVCSVIMAMSLSSVPVYFGTELVFILLSLLVFAVSASLFYAFFDGTVRNLLNTLKFVAPATGALIIFILVLNFDVFGYSEKIPDINDIESVTLTYKGDYRGISGRSVGGTNNNIFVTTVDLKYLPELTEQSDIQKAIDIHKAIIADGSMTVSESDHESYSDTVVYTDYSIVYKLKDGTEFIRSYPVMKLSTLYSTLAVEETDAYRAFREAAIRRLYARSVVTDETDTDHDYSSKTFAVSDNMLSSVTALDLTAEEKLELVNAIVSDKSKESYEQIYHPYEECLGVIWLEMPSEQRDYITSELSKYICVYSNDTEILSWLREKDMEDVFCADYTVKSVQLFSIDYYGVETVKKQAVDRFFGTHYNADQHTHPTTSIDMGYVSESDFQTVLSYSRLQYFTDICNKYAVITLINENGEEIKTTKYLIK